MHWLSNGRIVPILSDVSEIIVMPRILRAVVAGLLRPQGHKFQVSAGRDRTRWFVEWGVMRPFAILIGLSIAAICAPSTSTARRTRFAIRLPRSPGPGTI